MPSFMPIAVVSAILWTAIGWCVVSVGALIHHSFLPTSAHNLGGSLLCIVLALLGVGVLVDRRLREQDRL